MNNHILSSICCLLIIASLAGCARTRSISNSGYQQSGHRCQSGGDFPYRGELSEFDVLGINRDQTVTEDQIRAAAARATALHLAQQDTVLVIQSGAVIPDSAMVQELSRFLTVVPFSGTPQEQRQGNPGSFYFADRSDAYSKMLRLAAARAGAKAVICYWGALESASENMPTRSISWVPVVKWMVPDQLQFVRLQLKLAAVNVASGDYIVFSPPAFTGKDWSTRPRRSVVDQKQIEQLKSHSYEACAREFARLYIK